MALKTRDVPAHLQSLNKAFNQLTNNGYSIDLSVAFRDVIEYAIQQLSVNPNQEAINELRGRYKDFKGLYNVFREATLAIESALGGSAKNNGFEIEEGWEWSDIWGTYYEVLASQSKKSAFGQFFTPEHLCEMLARLTIEGSDDKDEVTVNEPCAGSGGALKGVRMF